MKFYKIVNPEGHYGLVYKEGLNIDPNPFNPSGNCTPGGIYFAREDILAFLDYGEELYQVEPVEEIYEEPGFPKKWKAHAVKLKYIGKVLDNIEFLIKEGANVRSTSDFAIRWASKNGYYEVVKLLLEYGADVHAGNDFALIYAAGHGHYEVVKLLLEHGADVHSDDDSALQWAAERGHSHVVELLKKYI
ncbi:MAG: ankyrin repeat domain-containing protein, partial [Calditerrivibrio sp.]|nr:ankyrin repeat domain-containing protein [Calditerrivibrio sp.]